jgi:putative heme iron utilization protein
MTAGLELLGVYVPHFRVVDIGTLSTLSRKQLNVLGSLMSFAFDPAGCPPSLISDIAMQTQNLKTDARCCSSLDINLLCMWHQER